MAVLGLCCCAGFSLVERRGCSLVPILVVEWVPWWLKLERICLQCRWTQVGSLRWEGPLEEGLTTHSSVLAWRILWTEEPDRVTNKLGTTERLTLFTCGAWALEHRSSQIRDQTGASCIAGATREGPQQSVFKGQVRDRITGYVISTCAVRITGWHHRC